MNVASLVAKLVPLLDAPVENSDDIIELLGKGRWLADYEVARFLVAKRTAPLVRELLANPDPRIRRQGVRWVELTFARAPAAKVLRDATKDRSRTVRSAAVKATRALRLDDVALPISSQFSSSRAYNPTGWQFGLYRNRSKPKRPIPELSALRTRTDVAAALQISPVELKTLLRPGAGPGHPYVAFEVPKASGGVRVLHAPRPELKRLQRELLRMFLAPLEAHTAAHGFVAGRSTVTNATPHIGARVILKLDIVDFFPTIHFGRVAGLFERHGAGHEAARTLAAIVTFRPKLPDGRIAWPSVLPQGAPTSPMLSNLVCRRLDARLTGLAERTGAAYTRYADDLTFSFRDVPEQGIGHFAWWVNQILGQEGFIENLKKRHVIRTSGQQRVTGLVTNTGLSVPRAARRRFRAVLHSCQQHGVTQEVTGHEEPRAYLLGFASYVAMVQPAAGAKFRAQVAALLSDDRKPVVK